MVKKEVDVRDLDPTHRFYTKNGMVAKNLSDLLGILEAMSKTTFEHHVTYHRNDFARWVREVIQDEKLALALFECENKTEMVKELKKRVKKTKVSKSSGLTKEEQVIRRVFEDTGILEKIDSLIEKEAELVKRDEKILQAEQHLESAIQEHKDKEVRFSLLILFIGFVCGALATAVFISFFNSL